MNWMWVAWFQFRDQFVIPPHGWFIDRHSKFIFLIWKWLSLHLTLHSGIVEVILTAKSLFCVLYWKTMNLIYIIPHLFRVYLKVNLYPSDGVVDSALGSWLLCCPVAGFRSLHKMEGGHPWRKRTLNHQGNSLLMLSRGNKMMLFYTWRWKLKPAAKYGF